MPVPLPELTPEHLRTLDHAMIDALPGGVVYVGVNGSILNANDEALRVLGLRYEELTQRYVADFEAVTLREDGSVMPVADYPVSRALATGEPQPGVTIGVRHPDGNIKWALFRAVPVKDPATGNLTGALVTFLDLTERRLAEEALRANRELLRKSQELAKLGAWEWDMVTGKVYWTDQMAAFHGMRREDFDGTLDASTRWVHPEDRERLTASIGEVMDGGTGAPLEYRIVRHDGTTITVLGWGEVFRDDAGRPLKMVGALQDISSYRQLESQLRQAQRMESVGLLAGGVAHDFNNLLQVILANVDMGLRGRAEARDVLTNVQLAAQRAAQLTQQLLAFGRRQPFNARGIEVQDLLQDVMRLVPRLFGEQIRLHQSVAPGLPLVRADAGLLQQVLVNLFINARDAMRDGGSVTIRALQGAAPHEVLARQPKPSECIVIEVADTGSGMSPEVSRRIFEPFFTTKEHGHGTGLGLAVVFGIVEQHGGAIRVESELGVGTTFRVFLPIADGTTHSTSPPAPRPSKVPCGGERLLVVEDEALVRRVVVNLLSDVGYDVVQAVDGIEALRLFEADPGGFHGVLTDVVMPGMGGIELARKLRTLRSNLPIVFATGYTTALAELENEIVLAKPYASSDLFETLGVALKRV